MELKIINRKIKDHFTLGFILYCLPPEGKVDRGGKGGLVDVTVNVISWDAEYVNKIRYFILVIKVLRRSLVINIVQLVYQKEN